MTPPIGFRTGSLHDSDSSASGGSLMEIRPMGLADAAGAALPPSSPFADYAYRIAALTAGIAMIATFL
jgi:hypothetical protein